MEHDERYAVVVFFIITLVSVGAVTFLFVNSKSSQPKQIVNPYFLTGGVVQHFCTDSDGGIEPYLRGVTTTERNQVIDRCTNVGVIEYSCTVTGEIMATNVVCPLGCEEGACVKESILGYAAYPVQRR